MSRSSINSRSAPLGVRRTIVVGAAASILCLLSGCTSDAGTAQTSPQTSASASSSVAPGDKTAEGSVSIPPPATKPVPPPSGGNVSETVPGVTPTTKPAVPLTATAEFGSNVTGRLAKVEQITTKAQGPGEISGPGVALTVVLKNGSKSAIDLGSVAMSLEDSKGVPGVQMSGAPNKPFSGAVAPGKSASAVFVFNLPAGFTGKVQISLMYSTAAPAVVFAGSIS